MEKIRADRYLERQALDVTDSPMVLTGLQRAKFFTGATRRIYRELAATCPLVVVFGHGIDPDMQLGVRGVALGDSDPLRAEWIVLMLGATTSAALIARERRDQATWGSDGDRRFDVSLTNDRALVTTAARILLIRMESDPWSPRGDGSLRR